MDRINIKGLEVFAYHGVEEQEKIEGQKFYIDAVLYCDMVAPGNSDDLEDTVNYAKVSEFIEKFLTENRFDLIEAAAQQTTLALLKRMPKIRQIDFTMNKPDAPIGIPFENVSVSISRKWHRAYLSIGSNIGEKEAYLNQAVESFYDNEHCRVIQVSKYVETKPYGPVVQDNFLNGCVEIETLYEAEELLHFIHRIEQEAGRTREIHWGPRTLDIDIILYDQKVIYEPNLIVPHKEMHKRAFVLVPLAEIAPYAYNPVLNKCALQLLDELTDEEKERAGMSKCTGCSGCGGCARGSET